MARGAPAPSSVQRFGARVRDRTAPSCPDLESGLDDPPQESVEQARQWLLEMDQKIQVHQLRQFLQTTSLTSEEALQTLLQHHLNRVTRVDSDRDKIDFLLVQFFSHCAPSRLEDADVDLGYVAQTLEPVLGSVDLSVPSWLEPIDDFIQSANGCRSLNELLTSGTLEKGRKAQDFCRRRLLRTHRHGGVHPL